MPRATTAKEEQALRRAVSADPRFTTGYAMLAQLYLRQKRTDEARAEFEAIVKRDPSASRRGRWWGSCSISRASATKPKKSTRPLSSGTENAPVAANNLAFIYAEQGTNLDEALQTCDLSEAAASQ